MMCRGSISQGPENTSDPWSATHFLTKPVYHATARPMPRWVGWLLIALPSLSVLGTWLLGRIPLFQFIAIILFVIAVWDWRRYFDRSRTIVAVLGLSGALLLSGIIAAVVHRPPTNNLQFQSIAMFSWIVLALALVQLYRSEQTVLTVIRGWMYAVAILAGITGYQLLTVDLPALNGPFPSPGYLAGSMVAGILLMPVGFSLEKDRRLQWTYPVVAVLATGVVWTTHRSVAFGCCVCVLWLWLFIYRRILAGVIAIIGIVIEIFLHTEMPMRWVEVGAEPPLTGSLHRRVIQTAWTILQDSGFIGVGPGGLMAHWPASQSQYRGPYFALIELASEYGLAVSVAFVCALLGAVVWSLNRLWQTRSGPLRSGERAPALWLAVMILSLPVTTSLQAQWL